VRVTSIDYVINLRVLHVAKCARPDRPFVTCISPASLSSRYLHRTTHHCRPVAAAESDGRMLGRQTNLNSTQLQERAKLFTTSPVHYCWTNCYQPHKQKIYFERRLSLRRARKRQLRTGSGAEGFRTERAPGQDSGCEALEVDSFFVDVHP